MNIAHHDPRAIALKKAIESGDVESLRRMFREDASLSTVRIVDARGAERSLLHIASDWPGHFPNGREVVSVLVQAGADPSARTTSKIKETPLHWAASSNDVEVLDALLDNGADIEAPGAVFTNGTAMSDAVVFGNWNAARRLLERGAKTTYWQAAALGLLGQVREAFEAGSIPPDEMTKSLWHACHGGQRQTSEFLLDRGAEINWIGWDGLTPLAAAQKGGNAEFVAWLRSRGGRLAQELR